MTAQLHFLAYVRQGLAAAGVAPDPIVSDIPARQPIQVGVRLTDHEEEHFDVRLYGPGDVRGVDTRQVIRMDPPPGAHDFEPNNLVTIEFDRPDFPWLFTPAGKGDRQRLRPWLFLVVVPVADSELRTDTGAPLPVLECDRADLPDLAESWAWAHAQVATADDTDTVASVLAGDPARTLSRLISPRRLASGVTYRACLVPAFEPGRLAGLGLDVDDTAALGPAWRTGEGAAPPLPVYHSWEFSTSDDGDFQLLASRLEPRALGTDVGLRPVWIGRSGMPDLDPAVPTVSLGVEGALRGATTMPSRWAAESREPVQALLRELITDTGTRLGPPLYGGHYAERDRIPGDSEAPHWLRELNLDPRHRIAAALGTRVVREQQETLMAAAWEQAAEVQRANEALRQAQLAAEASRSTYERRIVAGAASVAGAAVPSTDAGPLPPGRLLQVSGSVLDSVTVTPRSKKRIGDELGHNPTAAATLSTTFRRIARPHGPVARRVGANALDGLVEAAGENQVRATPPQREPAGTVLFDTVAGPDNVSFDRIDAQVDDNARWWHWPPPASATVAANPAHPQTEPAPVAPRLPPENPEWPPEDPDWPPEDPDWPPPPPPPPPPPVEPLPVSYPDSGPLPAGVPGQPTGLPAAVLSGPGPVLDGLRTYVSSGDGRLFELYHDGGRWLWSDHGTPPGTQAAGVEPGAAMDGGRRFFVASVQGALFEHYWESDRWLWRKHPSPPNTYGLGSAPSLVLNNQSLFVAETMNGNTNSKVGRLWERRRDGNQWSWVDHGNPGGTERITANPGAAHGSTRFFVVTDAGNLWERGWNGTRWLWIAHGRPADTVVADLGPSVGTTSVFVKTRDGRLFERIWSGTGASWQDHGRPSGVDLANMTYALMQVGEETSLFVGGVDGGLHQRRRVGASGAWEWRNLGTPPGTRVMQPPGAVMASRPVLFVSASDGRVHPVRKDGDIWRWGDPLPLLDSRGSGPVNAEPAPHIRWALPLGFLSNLVAAHVDNPAGDNTVYHRIGRDLGFEAEVRGGWSPHLAKPGGIGAETQGLGVAVADIKGRGQQLDLVLMWVENPAGANTICYQVGWNLGPTGEVTGGWGPVHRIPAEVAAEVQGADLALADLDGDGRPELVLAYATGGANPTLYYRIGWRLGDQGEITGGWSDSVQVPWATSGPIRGVGVAVADLDDDRIPDIVVLTLEPRGGQTRAVYRVGRRINPRGQVVGGWAPEKEAGGDPLPAEHQGAGIAVIDVTGTHQPDLVLFHVDSSGAENRGYYRVGWDLNHFGVARRWSADAPVSGWFGGQGQGAAITIADLNPALVTVRRTMGDAFAAAAGRHQTKVLAAQDLVDEPDPDQVDAAAMAARVATALHPVAGITERMTTRLALPGTDTLESLDQLVVVPSFPRPMYEAVRELSPEILFPGASQIPPETVTLLRVNASFVESFMVGLNSELAREMLWRRFPTDPRATFFRQFWDVRSASPSVGPLSDLPPIAGWADENQLGENATAVGAGDLLVVLVRGELLRRYPGTEIYVQKAEYAPDGTRRLLPETRAPQFTGRLDPDMHFFGLPLSVSDAIGDSAKAGWFVVFRQPPVDARFGLNAAPSEAPYGGSPATWSDLHWRHLSANEAADRALRHVRLTGGLADLRLDEVGWNHNGAHQARIVYQPPVLVAVHATDMVPPIDDTWQVDAIVRRADGLPQHRIVALAGTRSDGTPWRMDTDDVIAAIARHERFMVERPVGDRVRVRVSRTGQGRPYLTTEADGDLPNNLLSLPELAEDA
ncbi:DUF3892 domain-containing protein [Micromonospora sp. NPDC004704]